MMKPFSPLSLLAFALAAMVALAACGGGGDTTLADPAPTQDAPDDSVSAPADEPADASGEPEPESASASGCNTALTIDEIDSIFGSSVIRVSGNKFCNIVFREDAITVFAIFSGSEADEAMEFHLPPFLADEAASAAGVTLDDGRGFIDDREAVVRGESGRTFVFGLPDNVDVADVRAAMQDLADLLLTR